jgi:hypothetical protein
MALNKWKFTKTTGKPRNPGRRQGGKLPLFPAEQETLDATVLPELMRSEINLSMVCRNNNNIVSLLDEH